MLVQVYGECSSLQVADIFLRENVTDKERSGRSATSRTEENIAEVRQIAHKNRRLTVRSIAEQANIDRETAKSSLKIL
jgi:hypothetical protein